MNPLSFGELNQMANKSTIKTDDWLVATRYLYLQPQSWSLSEILPSLPYLHNLSLVILECKKISL